MFCLCFREKGLWLGVAKTVEWGYHWSWRVFAPPPGYIWSKFIYILKLYFCFAAGDAYVVNEIIHVNIDG